MQSRLICRITQIIAFPTGRIHLLIQSNLGSENEALIDRVYEAALSPDFWPVALHTLAQTVNGEGTILFVRSSTGEAQGLPSVGVARLWDDWLTTGWVTKAQRTSRLVARQHFGWTVDQDIFTDREINELPEYADFFRPRGFGWGAATTFEMPTGDAAVYSIERRFDNGPMSPSDVHRLDVFRPHLARAALVAVRTGINRARLAVETLGVLDLPAAAISSSGKLLAANAQMTAYIPSLIVDGLTGVALAERRSEKAFNEALTATLAGHAGAARSIAIRGNPHAGLPRCVVHLIPVRRSAHDVFGRTAALLLITPVGQKHLPSEALISALFDLTPAEARVAQGIGRLETIDEIAQKVGVSRETIRAQLKSVMAKTSVHRQAELASLIRDIPTMEAADQSGASREAT